LGPHPYHNAAIVVGGPTWVVRSERARRMGGLSRGSRSPVTPLPKRKGFGCRPSCPRAHDQIDHDPHQVQVLPTGPSRGPSAHGLDPWGRPGPICGSHRHRPSPVWSGGNGGIGTINVGSRKADSRGETLRRPIGEVEARLRFRGAKPDFRQRTQAPFAGAAGCALLTKSPLAICRAARNRRAYFWRR
jgi:hypothetical protein